MNKIELPPMNTDAGLELRLLLAECANPSSTMPKYNFDDAKECMKLMHLVLWNRVAHSDQVRAKSHTLRAVITALGQFQGFRDYPQFKKGNKKETDVKNRISSVVQLANNPHNKNYQAYADFIDAASAIASSQITISDPSYGLMIAWQTHHPNTPPPPSPSPKWIYFKTILGNAFYYWPVSG